jgi:hypothetical protein
LQRPPNSSLKLTRPASLPRRFRASGSVAGRVAC